MATKRKALRVRFELFFCRQIERKNFPKFSHSKKIKKIILNVISFYKKEKIIKMSGLMKMHFVF